MKTKLLLPVLALITMSSLSATIVSRSVPYEHAGTKLEGFVAYDDAKVAAGRIPGVLVVPEWWGLNDYVKGRAVQLAQMGYVAFVADMYGAGVVTTDAKKAGQLAGQFYGKPLMAERAQAGLDVLLKTEGVDASRVAAIGYCFGGSTVQALAYTGAPLKGIVSFHGGLIPVPADAAAKTKAKILICQGAVDPMTAKDVPTFKQSMDDGKFDYQIVMYAGAVHAFTNPGADELARQNDLSGIAYNAAADHRSWAHMRVFFRELFGSQK